MTFLLNNFKILGKYTYKYLAINVKDLKIIVILIKSYNTLNGYLRYL